MGTDMHDLIWPGAIVALLGAAGIVWAAVSVLRAKAAKLDEAAMRVRMQRAITMNLGFFLLSVLGLMAVVIGVILG